MAASPAMPGLRIRDAARPAALVASGPTSWPMVRGAVGQVLASGSATSLPPTSRPHRPGSPACVSIQDADPTGQTVLRCSPANRRSMPSPTRCWTSVARWRASRIRPSRSACSATMRCAIGSSPPVPRCAWAASAAPSRSPLRHRDSARSTSASQSSVPAPAICSSSARARVSRPPRRWSRERRASAVRTRAGGAAACRGERVRRTGSGAGSRSTVSSRPGVGPTPFGTGSLVVASVGASVSGPTGMPAARDFGDRFKAGAALARAPDDRLGAR